MLSQNNTWLKTINNELGYYITGFVDGEGSFNVSLRKRTDHTLGWQVILTFNVAQKDTTMLHHLKKTFGCGRIQTRKDGVSMFIIQNPELIEDRVIPFFKKFKFLSSSKKKNFTIFCRISKLMLDKSHLTTEGFTRIVELREKLNEGHGRTRKYTIEDI